MVSHKIAKNIVLSGLLLCSVAQGALSKKTAAVATAGAFAGLPILYTAAQLACGNSLSEIGALFQQSFKHGTEIGTFAPCSRYLGKALVEKLPEPTDNKPRYFLEPGAGTGIVTGEFLNKMGPNDKLDVVELLEPLCTILKEKFKGDSRVTIHCCSILDFRPDYRYDGIATTLPFNAFSIDFTQAIWNHLRSLLTEQGTLSCVNYRFFPEMRLKIQGKESANKLKAVMDFLDDEHKKNGIGYKNVWRNVPPIRVRHFTFRSNQPAPEHSQVGASQIIETAQIPVILK